MELELRNPGTKTFIDCDDLTDLTRLFSYVGQDSRGWKCAASQYTEDCELFESLRDENRPHPGNRTERKEAGLLGPTKSRLPSNLAVLGLKLVRSGAHLSPAELGPLGSNLGPTGVQHGATWHVWMQVGLSIRNLVLCGGLWCQSWAQDRPNVGNMALHEPLIKAKKRKNVGNSGKRASFQGVALNPQNCPNLAPLDPKLRCLGPSWSLSWCQMLGRNWV